MTARRIGLFALTAALFTAGCSSSNPYQGMGEEEMWAYAQQKYQDHDWDRVIQTMDRFFASYAGTRHAEEGRLLLADTYAQKGDYLTARSEYQRFLDRFPGSPQAAVAALGMCKSLVALSPIPQRDQQYTQDAIVTCRNVVADYANTPQAQEAATLANNMRIKLAEKDFLNADFYFRRKLWDPAIVYFQFVVDQYPETDYAPKALKGIYDCNMAIGYDDLAEDARKKLLEQYPDSPEAAALRTEDDAGS